MSQPSDLDSYLDIEVISRKLKSEDDPPSNILFRTHNYELHVVPDPQFFNWTGRTFGFWVELQLFKKNTKNDDYSEFTDCGVPIISYSFTETATKTKTNWLVNVIWPTTQYNWKGDFHFVINIYRKSDSMTFKKILTKVSHDFNIFSKPSVYLKRKRENEKTETSVVENKENKKKENKFYQENTEKDLLSIDLLELTPPSRMLSQDILNSSK